MILSGSNASVELHPYNKWRLSTSISALSALITTRNVKNDKVYNQKKPKVQLCSCFSWDIWPPQSRNLSLTARYSVCKIGVVLILTLTLALRCGAAYVKCSFD